jgi:hypothetical protein
LQKLALLREKSASHESSGMLGSLIDAATLSLLTFFLGLFIGHRLTLARDRRREFNQIVEPLRPGILDEAEAPNPMRLVINRHQADAIACRLCWGRAERFLKACHEYWDAHDKHDKDDLGQPLYRNPEPVRQAVKKLLEYVKPMP